MSKIILSNIKLDKLKSKFIFKSVGHLGRFGLAEREAYYLISKNKPWFLGSLVIFIAGYSITELHTPFLFTISLLFNSSLVNSVLPLKLWFKPSVWPTSCRTSLYRDCLTSSFSIFAS